MFFKVLRYDLKNGIGRAKVKFLIALGIFLMLAVDFFFRSAAMSATGHTFGDYLLYIFLGMSEYDPEAAKLSFQFPALWTLVMLYALYMVLYYPYQDLMGVGKQVLVSARSRRCWWLSKCGWLIVHTALYFALLYGAILLFSLATGATLSMDLSAYIFHYFVPMDKRIGAFPQQMNLTLLLLPFLLVTALGLWQMVLSLLIRPLYSYCVTIVLLLSSAYYLHPLMIGNYAMVLRSDRVVRDGVRAETGVWLLVALAVASAFVGMLIFERYDILKKGGDAV